MSPSCRSIVSRRGRELLLATYNDQGVSKGRTFARRRCLLHLRLFRFGLVIWSCCIVSLSGYAALLRLLVVTHVRNHGEPTAAFQGRVPIPVFPTGSSLRVKAARCVRVAFYGFWHCCCPFAICLAVRVEQRIRGVVTIIDTFAPCSGIKQPQARRSRGLSISGDQGHSHP